MSSDKMREEFEAWASENGMAMHLVRADSGLYVSRVTQNYMDCWMASRTWQAAEIEALRKYGEEFASLAERRREQVEELASQVKALQSDANSYQSGYDAGRAAAKAHADSWRAEAEKLRATADLQKLLPDLSDALEELEMHGQHSDQGYRKLRDWYRKVALAYRVITGPMFGADHAELVSQNTWLRKMVGHQAEQHAPMEPIADPDGWSRRLPGYDLPALLRDAERYRYLRNGAYSFENSRREIVAIEDLDAPKYQFPSGAEMLDAAIDAAMSKEAGQ